MHFSSGYFIVGAMLLSGVLASTTWDYGVNGPSEWSNSYANCGGQAQSPINIQTSNVKINSSLGLFNRDMFTAHPTTMQLKNNGHALQMDVTGGYVITDHKILPFPAKLEQFHLHWGQQDGRGSEHKVDDYQYYGELHLVHSNSRYASLTEAASQSDGLAVIAVFLEYGYEQDFKPFDWILDIVRQQNITDKDDSYAVSSKFSVETLLPHDLSAYYRYKGSLTTPSCDESVVWTVFKEPMRISNSQASALSGALYWSDSSGSRITDNYRPVQNLNGRTVYMPTPLTQDSAGNTARPTFIVSIIASLLAAFF